MKKRILSIVLCAAMVMALAAGCGKKEEIQCLKEIIVS